jgi:endogenous inhibitor of DNA gyrase (YacG/DUF329 family)
MYCPKCEKVVKHKHIYDAAYGIPETYMVGTERYECVECGYQIYKKEEEQGLKFTIE